MGVCSPYREVFGETHMKLLARIVIGALVLALGAHCSVGQARTPTAVGKPSLQKATFAGGCFWCMEDAFEGVPGVVSAISGYTGGTKKNPTYEEVSSGGTGHFESVEVAFDPAKVSYEKLLSIYWENVDPLTPYGQFCDNGEQYRTAIFVHDDAQRKAAEASKAKVEERLKAKVVTFILPASTFYPAEDYHQKYAKKNPFRYGLYRKGCGRDELLQQIWGVKPVEGNKETP
jgi:peptide-methionine (S)-S-oxide reductase